MMQGELIKKWGHDELQNDLAAYIRSSSDRLAWTNMPMGSAGNCRPDVFAIPKSFANFTPIIYEIKVSVSDFRSDVTSGKWQSYLKYACGVVFAVPAGLISKDDVPKGCGLIVRHDEVWRMVKKPTMQFLDTLPKELWIKLLIDGIDRQAKLMRDVNHFNEYVARDKLKQKFGEKIAKLLSDLSRAESSIEYAIVQAKNVEKEISDARQRKLDKAREEDALINQAKTSLCKALGLEPDASHWVIERKCTELAHRLNESDEIKRLTSILSNIESAIADGQKAIPQFKAAA
jgi:hypothetical protein